MSSLTFEERDAILDILESKGGWCLDFTDRTFQEFFIEKTGMDPFALYPGLSKGKTLSPLSTANPWNHYASDIRL
jgi:hypothetical protein